VTLRFSRALAAAATVLALSRATTSKAEDGTRVTATLDLKTVPGSSECIGRRGIEKAVDARLGRPVFTGEDPADVILRLELGKADDGWQARLTLLSRSGRELGRRQLETRAPHCSALDDSLALVVALLLDLPREKLAGLQPTPPVALPPSEAAPTPLRLPADTHAARVPWIFEPALLGTLAPIGLLPEVSFGFGLRLGVVAPYFVPVQIDLEWWLPAQARIDEAGSEFRLVTAALFICALDLQWTLWRARACVGQRVGRLGTEGFGFDRNHDRSRFMANVGVRGQAGILLAELIWLDVGAGLEIPLTRDQFVFTRSDGSTGELFRMGAVIPTIGVAAGLSF
jgi:hypothetical protein